MGRKRRQIAVFLNDFRHSAGKFFGKRYPAKVNFSLLGDPLLLLIMAMAGFVSMCTSLQVATRPAAVLTGRVGTALSMGQLVFIATRFGNMFYLPLLGNFVDDATRSGDIDLLLSQVHWVVLGSAGGALIAFLMLPTFVELCTRGVPSVGHRGMLGALLNLVRSPRAWRKSASSFRKPSLLGARLTRLEGLPVGFLLANVLASAIWTVGALAAITVSGIHPEVKQTAILLSGLVNSFAAIAFSVWVDPQAALILDQAVKGKRPASHVNITAMFLALGNFVGCLCGWLLLTPAVKVVGTAAQSMGTGVGGVNTAIIYLVLANALIWLLAGTINSSRVAAVRTANIAVSIAVFNFFSLIARVATQIYAPFVGAVTDKLTHRPSGVALEPAALAHLETFYRQLLGGAALGCVLALVLLPTFVRVYVALIDGMEREGTLAMALVKGLSPGNWRHFPKLLAAPWKQAVSWAALRRLPKGFLWANVIVLGCQTVSQLAAIYAGATFAPEVARTTTLLSPLINGVATIVLSLLVDPTCNILVDQAKAKERPEEDIETMSFTLAAGAVVGTLLSQLLFIPAAMLISAGAQFLDTFI